MDPFSEEAIKAANPAFGTFLNAREVLAMAADASRMPAREAEFRNLVLNQRVEASSPFLAREVWMACAGKPIDIRGKTVFAGLDLSETKDLTALVLAHCDPNTGVWHIRPYFWLPEEGLAEKAKHDSVPYDLWNAQGYLETTPGNSISYDYVARRLKDIFDEYEVAKVAFDRWNFAHLKPWLAKAGFSEPLLEQIFIEFGQGTKSMSPALRELESIILDRKLRHGGNPVMNMCAANAVTEGIDASNRKLSKKRSTGRIDGMVALAMAIGVGPSGWKTPFDPEALIG